MKILVISKGISNTSKIVKQMIDNNLQIIIEREVVIMSDKIFEMLNLFYANKYLYEKIKKRVDKQNNK